MHIFTATKAAATAVAAVAAVYRQRFDRITIQTRAVPVCYASGTIDAAVSYLRWTFDMPSFSYPGFYLHHHAHIQSATTTTTHFDGVGA